jgi:hypothetical protein
MRPIAMLARAPPLNLEGAPPCNSGLLGKPDSAIFAPIVALAPLVTERVVMEAMPAVDGSVYKVVELIQPSC